MDQQLPDITTDADLTLAGDPADDDARVVDEQIDSYAIPPTPAELPQTRFTPSQPPQAMTRLLTVSLALQNGWDPQLILPADPNRIALSMWAASSTSTDYARFGDDAGKLQSLGGSGILYSGQLLQLPRAHTGPLYVSAPDSVGPVTVTVCAVTS